MALNTDGSITLSGRMKLDDGFQLSPSVDYVDNETMEVTVYGSYHPGTSDSDVKISQFRIPRADQFSVTLSQDAITSAKQLWRQIWAARTE